MVRFPEKGALFSVMYNIKTDLQYVYLPLTVLCLYLLVFYL